MSAIPTARAVDPPPDGGYTNGNTAEGTNALFSLTTGANNVAVGFEALHANTSGSENTSLGGGSLHSNTTGGGNTATGINALFSNTTGSENTATGAASLYSNTSGSHNTANGVVTLHDNIGGIDNTAAGYRALRHNTSGNFNSAYGSQTLVTNSTGSGNTATGAGALYTNTIGVYNTATGYSALGNNLTGGANVANGPNALGANVNGTLNTGVGYRALLNSTGDNNIALGAEGGENLTTGSNNIDIGAPGKADEANTIRIGTKGTQKKAFIQGIFDAPVADGVRVMVNASGKLGTMPSSARFKEEIKPMAEASEALLALKPVTFRYKPELDGDSIPQFGLIAEEVEKVNPDLVARDENGKVFTVRYEAVNSMLLNEFLKEHCKVEELKAQQQRSAALATQQQQQIDALTAGLQKVIEKVQSGPPVSVEPSSQH